MSLDQIAPIADEPVAPPPEVPAEAPAEAPESTADAQADAPEPLSVEALTEQLERAERAAERLSKERREARAELERERQVYRDLISQLRQPEVAKPAAPVEDVEPDSQADPEGWLRWSFQKSRDAAAKVEAWERQQAEARKQQEEFAKTYQSAVADYTAFAEEEAPDFNEAYEFVRGALRKEYAEKQFYDRGRWRNYTDNEIDQILAAEEAAFIRQTKADGVRPAALLYDYAKRRGYRKSAAAAQIDESDRRRAEAERVRSMPAASSGAEPQLTYEWVVENIDSPNAKDRARAEAAWDRLNSLPRKR